MKIVPDLKYKNMYRIKWENGDISVGSENPKPWQKGGIYGFYNKTRAKELIKSENIENYTKGLIYKASVAQLEARGCV